MWILPTNASYAFHSMFESQGELRGYANLFILGPEREEELKNPANPAHEIQENVVKRKRRCRLTRDRLSRSDHGSLRH